LANDEFYKLKPKKYSTELMLHRVHDKQITFHHGYIAIHDYTMGDCREFEKDLSVFDDCRWKYTMMGGYYIPELKEFRINRGYDPSRLAMYFKGYMVKPINDAYPADKVDIQLLTPPRDDFQRVGLTFMCSQDEYKRNSYYTQMMITARTGSGKSFLGIATGCFMQARTIVIVPFGILLTQWKNAYLEFTNLKDDEILIVQGSNECKKILEGKRHNVKVFIFSIDTIVSFCEHYGPLETMDMLRETNCYVKIVDEVHKDMKAITMVEALCNFHMNFYMSATPGRVQQKEQWIFKCLFKNMPKYGDNFVQKSEEHINVMIKRYDFVPNAKQQSAMIPNKRKGWLSPMKYEEVLFNAPDEQKSSFVDGLIGMLKWSKKLLKENNKILILCSTVDGTKYLKELAETVFPGECSNHYGGMKKAEKTEALKARIICATGSSLGTGADISGVQHVYNVSTYTNWIAATQTPGRARKLADGTMVWYIELVNFAYIKTYRQYEKRKPELIKVSRTGKIVRVD